MPGVFMSKLDIFKILKLLPWLPITIVNSRTQTLYSRAVAMATEISGFSQQSAVASEASRIKPDTRQAPSEADMKTAATLVDTEYLEKIQSVAEEADKPEQVSKAEALSVGELQEILNEINSALYSQNRSLKFDIHDKTDDLVVRVWNTKTDEVIRQYPSEEVLARRARLLEGDTQSFSTQVS